MVRLLFISLALLQAAAIRAVVVPENLPDGVYSIPFDDYGDASGEPVFLRPIEANSALSRRQNSPPTLPQSTVKCGNRGNININDFQVAKADLQNECDQASFYPTNTAIVHLAGSAVAYFCNYGTGNRCWRQEYEEAMQRIVNSCGSGKGGEVYIRSYDKAYGGDNAGGNICTS